VALTLENRWVGNATVVTCTGRLVAGAESSALQQHLDALIPVTPHIVLHLGGIEFLDSAGLGLLVRCRARAENANTTFKVCALSPKVEQILKVTRLTSTFQPYETEAEAITDLHQSGPRQADGSLLTPDVLCLDRSPDVVAYLRALLTEAGYRVITAINFPDALILLKATRPKVVVTGADFRAGGTRAAEEFHELAKTCALVEIPEGFSAQDAGQAGAQLISAVRAQAS